MFTLVIVILVLGSAALALSAPLLWYRLEPYLVSTPAIDAATALGRPLAGVAPYSERDRVLEELSELEHSRAQGKVTEADYATQRERLEREYLRIAGDPGDGR